MKSFALIVFYFFQSFLNCLQHLKIKICCKDWLFPWICQ